MSSGSQNISHAAPYSGLLLVTNPRSFFAGVAPGPWPVWRHLILVSLAAAVLGGFSSQLYAALVGSMVLFINAVGMTLIFTGCVFLCLGLLCGRPLSLGRTFGVCAWASLGPILISWIPGAAWVSEPWKWWVATIGLSMVASCGIKKAAGAVACAVCIMYGLFWIVLSNI